MDVWVSKVKRKATCFYCQKPIELEHKFLIVCNFWFKTKGGKNWRHRIYFHATPQNCWLERAMAELDSRPTVETRGRKALVLSDDKKAERYRILRQHASTVSRLRREMENSMRPALMLKLAEKLDALRERIKDYGGVPDSW